MKTNRTRVDEACSIFGRSASDSSSVTFLDIVEMHGDKSKDDVLWYLLESVRDVFALSKEVVALRAENQILQKLAEDIDVDVN